MAPTPNRFPLAILMGFIGVVAVGLGLMRNGSWLAERITLGVVPFVLLVGLLEALVRRGEGAWVGFTLFGCFASSLALMPSLGGNPNLRLDPAAEMVDWFADELHPQFEAGLVFPELNPQFMQMTRVQHFTQLETNREARALLTPAETEKFDDFMSRWHAYEDSSLRSQERRFYAGYIGHAWFALLFALLGAILGWALEKPRPTLQSA